MLNKSLVQILTKVNIPPPPVPWIVRPAINIVMLDETPLIRLPIKNTANAVSKAGLRPQISLKFPHDGVDAAVAKR